MRQIITALLILGFSSIINAQENPPTLSGKVKISIVEGTFECDLKMSNIPPIQDYLIRLNAGMNLLHIKSLKPNEFVLMYNKSKKDTMSSGESFAYYFEDNTGEGKFLPDELQFRYVGKFPVATDTVSNYSRDNWKVEIYDCQGRLAAAERYTQTVTSSCDISNLPSGFYTIKCIGNNDNSTINKLIKQ